MKSEKEKNFTIFSTIVVFVLFGLILSLVGILCKLSNLWVGALFLIPSAVGFIVGCIIDYIDSTIERKLKQEK